MIVPHQSISHRRAAPRYWQADHCLHSPRAVFSGAAAGFILQNRGATEFWLRISRQSFHHRRLLVRLKPSLEPMPTNPDCFLRWHECVYTPAAKRANLSQMSQHGPQNPQSTETFSMCRAKGDNPRLPKQITDVRARLNHPDCPRKTARVTHLFDYLSCPAGRLTGNGKFEFKDVIKKKKKEEPEDRLTPSLEIRTFINRKGNTALTPEHSQLTVRTVCSYVSPGVLSACRAFA